MTRMLRIAALTAALATAATARAGKPCDCAKHGEKAAATAPASSGETPPGAAAAITFPDETLRDQDGDAVKIASGVIGDRIAVMDFIFTTCTTVCPILSGIMTGVQDGLGADAADVALLSVTVDPERDTPERLAAYARKWRAGPRWRFLTGEREAVTRVLQAAGAYTASFAAHPPMVLVGDGRTGKWVRLNGFPKRAQVLAAVQSLREARAAVKTASAGGANP